MSDIISISKLRYLSYNKKAPVESRFKGVITEKSITGLQVYHGQEAKKEEKIIQQDLMSYSSKIKEHHTLTNQGYLDSEEKALLFRQEFAQHFNQEGRFCWDLVVSLPSYEVAKEHGLFSAVDYTAFVEKGLAQWFRLVGLDYANMIFWIDHHNDTDNPHCHVGFMEKEQHVEKGFISKKKLDQLKKSMANQLLIRKEFVQQKRQSRIELLKEKDQYAKQVKDTAKRLVNEQDNQIADEIKELYSKIGATGRLQYNSIHMKEHREQLDSIVNRLLESNEEIKQQHQQLNQHLLNLDKVVNQATGSKRNTMFEKENEKLKVQIANYILKGMKDYRDVPKHEKRVVLDTIPSTITQSEDVTELVHYPGTKIKILFDDTDIKNTHSTLKEFEIVSNKKYKIIDEEGVGQTMSGTDVFNKVNETLLKDATFFKKEEQLIIHNSQLELSADKIKINLNKEKTVFKVDKEQVMNVNHLYSLIQIKDEKQRAYSKGHYQYVSKKELETRISANTKQMNQSLMQKTMIKNDSLNKNTAKKICRHSRRLGMSWMNKVQAETEQAMREYLAGYEFK